MNTGSIPASSLGSEVAISVLRKALDIEAQNALLLINAISPPQQPSLPPNLGNTINTTA